MVLRRTEEALAAPLAAYHQRNRDHLARWEPPTPSDFFSEEGQHRRLHKVMGGEARGTDCAWWLFAKDDPAMLIGSARLSQIIRGPFCNAMLGYGLDATRQGQGLMHEALQVLIDHAFSDQFVGKAALHRIQANARPENLRSLSLLERLGFAREGVALQYLFIDGAWRDHVMCAIRHPAWPSPPLPPS